MNVVIIAFVPISYKVSRSW